MHVLDPQEGNEALLLALTSYCAEPSQSFSAALNKEWTGGRYFFLGGITYR